MVTPVIVGARQFGFMPLKRDPESRERVGVLELISDAGAGAGVFVELVILESLWRKGGLPLRIKV